MRKNEAIKKGRLGNKWHITYNYIKQTKNRIAIYKIESNPTNDTQKAVAISLLNNLLGRFGISLEQDVTKLLTYKQFMIVSNMYPITSYHIISDDLHKRLSKLKI